MTLNEYQEKAMRTATLASINRVNSALGMSAEAGEFADVLKKHLYHGHPMGTEQMIEEAGDVLWYVALAAKALGVTLEGLAQHNIKKLEKRYPDGFDPERSLHREE